MGQFLRFALFGVIFLSPAQSLAGETPVIVFAAASMAAPVEALAVSFNERHGGAAVTPSFAASSTLARQIEYGAPAHIYISANRQWMDYLDERGRIDRSSRCNLVGNRLVLAAPADSALDLAIAPGFDLLAALGGQRLAMGDPDHVPAGMYGRQALEGLGVWPSVADRLVRSPDVRAVLALVARGEVAAGIVYASDASVSGHVRIVGAFPAASHDPIIYPIARVAGDDAPAAATAFYDYLVSAEGRALLADHGFAIEGLTPCPD